MRRAGFQHFGALAAYGVGLALTALPGRQYLANGEQFEQWSLEQHGDGHMDARAWPERMLLLSHHAWTGCSSLRGRRHIVIGSAVEVGPENKTAAECGSYYVEVAAVAVR